MIWSWMCRRKGTGIGWRLRLMQCHSSSAWCCGQKQKQKEKQRVNSQSLKLTVSRCPSDLIALSLFLWTAQRRRHDMAAIDHIVTVLRRLTHRYNTVSATLSELKSIGCASLTNPKSQLVLLRVYWRAGMYDMVVEAYEHMQSAYGFVPNTFARNLLMDVLFRTGHSHVAVSLSLFNHTHPPNFFTFNIALFHLSNMNLKRQCHNTLPYISHIFRATLRAGYSPSPLTFRMLLHSFCNINALPQAFQLLALMTVLGIDFSVNIWTILIHNYCRLGRLHLAANLFNNMLQTGELLKVQKYHKAVSVTRLAVMNRYPLDSVAYSVGLCALLRDGRIQEAWTLYYWMKDNGLNPSVHTYNMMFFTFCKAKDLPVIKQILREMIESGIHLNDRNVFNLCKNSCRLDIYLSVLNLLAEMRDLRLLSAKALHALNFVWHEEGVQAKHKHQAEVNTKCNPILYSSSSEDLSDVAASVG
ncbi:putative pentatricopeptide repeat-containing protein At1g16830 isoform X3 [Vigna radiata var. radiata]|uniref:Pentatricopeptide repeat-containing protein At1g16830 isoform X3 n=1 Tax=Vigna radiata var. radiata TaxID=3916 RepID=A0A3Q0EYN2_VIGRR|nr:putative pentatricopeptide repeat-containing protein At1g16830 isoform X3 [Vigna radiata var. radiata]